MINDLGLVVVASQDSLSMLRSERSILSNLVQRDSPVYSQLSAGIKGTD